MIEIDKTGIEQVVRDFQYAYMNQILKTGHNATGNLALNQKYRLDWDGRYFSITFILPKYAIYLEEGTKPHFPPVNKILEWVKIKPVLPRAGANGKLPTQNQLAFLIARKISKVGTPATHLLQDTLDQFHLKNKVIKEFKTAYAEAIKKDFIEKYNGQLRS